MSKLRRFSANLRPAIAATALCCSAFDCQPAAAEQKQYTYRVEAAGHGDIGTYHFVFDTTGDTVVATVEGHLEVTALGVQLYARSIAGRERWVKDRLQEFHEETTINGTPVVVDGHSEGDHFVIRTNAGETSVPATVRPISPWTVSTPGGTTMFVAGTGEVKQFRINPAEDTTIRTDDGDTTVRRYSGQSSDGTITFEAFIDAHGTPLVFKNKDPVVDATLTLVR